MPLRPVFIGFLLAFTLHGQNTLDEYLAAIARAAATFATTAPGLMAEETLDQRGRRTHHVTSSYAFAVIGEERALHEIRKIVTTREVVFSELGVAASRPVVRAVGLAVILLGDRLSIVQVLGGVLVLLAVVIVQGAQLWRPGAAEKAAEA